jgi:hypothetical protein
VILVWFSQIWFSDLNIFRLIGCGRFFLVVQVLMAYTSCFDEKVDLVQVSLTTLNHSTPGKNKKTINLSKNMHNI